MLSSLRFVHRLLLSFVEEDFEGVWNARFNAPVGNCWGSVAGGLIVNVPQASHTPQSLIHGQSPSIGPSAL